LAYIKKTISLDKEEYRVFEPLNVTYRFENGRDKV
jgi:hypothetical protein